MNNKTRNKSWRVYHCESKRETWRLFLTGEESDDGARIVQVCASL